jgi:hypothetical protein
MQARSLALLALASLVSTASKPFASTIDPSSSKLWYPRLQVLAEQQLEQGVYDARGDW